MKLCPELRFGGGPDVVEPEAYHWDVGTFCGQAPGKTGHCPMTRGVGYFGHKGEEDILGNSVVLDVSVKEEASPARRDGQEEWGYWLFSTGGDHWW